MDMTRDEWREIDYSAADRNLPNADELVWVFDAFEETVDIGWSDGFGFVTVQRGEDNYVTHWRPLQYPDAPTGFEIDEPKGRPIVDIPSNGLL